MSRQPRWRRVDYLPNITSFKPAGVPLAQLQEIRISIEEIEAIRLKDLEGLELWDISRAHVDEHFPDSERNIRRFSIVKYLINLNVSDLLENTLKQIKESDIKSVTDLETREDRAVGFSDEMNAKRIQRNQPSLKT